MNEKLLSSFPALGRSICLAGHSGTKYDTGLNWVLYQCDAPFLYRYITEDLYEILGQLDGRRSLAEIVAPYDDESRKEIESALLGSALKPFLEFHENPQPCPDDFQIRVRRPVRTTYLPLNSVHFHISNKCNFKCKHCYHSVYEAEPGISSLPLKTVRNLFQRLYENGVSFVYFSGGEPLLNRDFLAYLRILRDLRIPYGFISNFYFMTEDLLTEIAEIGGCRQINTSLDGPTPEIHNEFRGARDSFERSLRLIPKAVQAGFTVFLNSAIHRGWLGREHLWPELIQRLGVRNWRVEYSAPVGRFLENEETWGLSPGELAHAYERIGNAISESGLESRLDSYMLGRNIRKTDNILLHRPDDPICMQHIDLMFLEANGDIPYCSLFSKQFPTFGNLLKDDPIETWNRICDWRLQRRLKDLGCGSCQFMAKCGGGCPGMWEKPFELKGCDLENRFMFENRESHVERAAHEAV